MLRAVVLAGLAALLPAEALAVTRLQSASTSCDAVRATVRAEGAVILRWQSERVAGLPRFERIVRDRSFCLDHEYAKLIYAPAADTKQCPVRRCEELLSIDDGLFRRR
ncbi:MAG: hypothetical protein DI629_01440 [Mesorhizobium amorphae]|nr:MAG: hypothetical protein DI629_01440 [Mesorhizobium amorphae]